MDPVLGPITSCGALLNVGLDSQLSVGLDVQAFCPFLAFQKKTNVLFLLFWLLLGQIINPG